MFEVETTSCYANTNLRNHFRQGIWPQRLDGALQVARLRDEFQLQDARISTSLMFPCVKKGNAACPLSFAIASVDHYLK